MPIYEYYCPQCQGKFRHLARTFDAPAPPCPRCDNPEVSRLVSAAALVHSQTYHEEDLRVASRQVDAEDDQAIAQFLQDSGRLKDAEGVYGSKAYRELLARRAEGATDAEVNDLVDDLVAEMRDSDATKMAGATMFSEQFENRMLAEGPPDDHDHEHADTSAEQRPSAKRAEDLGWS